MHPTEKETKDFIKRIPIEVRKMNYEQLVQVCNAFIPRIPILPLKFENELFFFGQREFSGWNLVYRGRKITNLENRPHPKVADINYIQETELHKIKEFGRVNRKGESMFYGALGYPTACFETLSKGIDFKNMGFGMVSVGTWRITKPLNIVQLPYSKKYWNKLNDITDFNIIKTSNEKIEKQNNKIKQLINDDLSFEILTLFADAFANFEIECEQDYYLSNYFKDRVFNNINGFKVKEDFDTILFPSVPNAYESDNIVIKPSAVDSKLKFIEAMQVWVVHHKQATGSVEFIPIEQKVDVDENGILKWR